MDILESLYEKPPHALHILDRKVRIKGPNTLLIGPKNAGKTTLIVDYLSALSSKTYLYVDLNDLRIKKEDLANNLFTFYQKHNLSLLVIDNYEKAFPLNSSMQVLLSSDDHSLQIDGLDTLFLDALDFEEFIAFSKAASIESLFNLYANYGRQPEATFLHESQLLAFLQSKLRLELYEPSLLEIFCFMATYQSRPVSLHHIYKNLKASIRLSKDKLYL
ncbi:MAG: ATP-binding protein, partial [Campylobacteraceae bacterium]|nr:ATP-binding protein [Campylobacteraceae bacterium]